MAEETRKTFSLSVPVPDLDQTPLNELSLRKPKPKDLRVLDRVEGEIAGMLEIIAKLAGVPVASIDDMDIEDLVPIIDWVTGFLPRGAAPGSES